MRFFLHLSYLGTNFSGWQLQPQVKTIQGSIEDALSSIFKKRTYIVGCGRTDAGVHASQYFAHFDSDTTWDFDLCFRLNKILPPEISIHEIIEVEQNNHARFDARKRTYDYYFHTTKNPFISHSSTLYQNFKFDFQLMHKACEIIKNQKEFKMFCLKPDDHKSTQCLIFDSSIISNHNETRFQFHIESNHFLRGMIRILVGKIVAIGLCELTLTEFKAMFLLDEYPKKYNLAPPQGLYLSRIQYPYLNTEALSNQL